MKKNPLTAFGFWFVTVDLILSLTTAVLSMICEEEEEKDGALLSLAITSVVINLLWALAQRRQLCQWSGLQYADAEMHRRFLPRWAITIPLSVLFYLKATNTIPMANKEYPVMIAISTCCVSIPALHAIELIVILGCRYRYDGQTQASATNAAGGTDEAPKYVSLAKRMFDSRLEFDPSNPQSNATIDLMKEAPWIGKKKNATKKGKLKKATTNEGAESTSSAGATKAEAVSFRSSSRRGVVKKKSSPTSASSRSKGYRKKKPDVPTYISIGD